MICEHEISDIFEIKFCPWWYPNYKIDEKSYWNMVVSMMLD